VGGRGYKRWPGLAPAPTVTSIDLSLLFLRRGRPFKRLLRREGQEEIDQHAEADRKPLHAPIGAAAEPIAAVRMPYSYGYEEELYELAVLKDGELHYDNPVAKGDVRGYLTEAGVEELGSAVERFPRRLTPFYLCTEWVRRSRSWLGKRLRAAFWSIKGRVRRWKAKREIPVYYGYQELREKVLMAGDLRSQEARWLIEAERKLASKLIRWIVASRWEEVRYYGCRGCLILTQGQEGRRGPVLIWASKAKAEEDPVSLGSPGTYIVAVGPNSRLKPSRLNRQQWIDISRDLFVLAQRLLFCERWE
jgi:hypothetical protein